jgi:ketosteroid isomerase-like protein
VSQNLDLVRSIYADWERGAYGRVDWADREIEWVLADGPAVGRWTGHDGMAAGFREFLGAWQDFRTEVEEIREIDSEHVVVRSLASGRGKASGIDLGTTPFTHAITVFRIRAGKVVRLAIYGSQERALADLGLEEG